MQARTPLLLLVLLLSAVRSVCAADPAEHALDGLDGDWVGVRRDGVSGEETPMTVRVESILGGRGRTFHLEVGTGEEPYRGFSMSVYSQAKQLWERRYSNSSGRIAVLEGEVTAGNTVVWRGRSPGRTRESKLVSERAEAEGGRDRWTRTMWISEDGGESWSVLWMDELERSGPPGRGSHG